MTQRQRETYRSLRDHYNGYNHWHVMSAKVAYAIAIQPQDELADWAELFPLLATENATR